MLATIKAESPSVLLPPELALSLLHTKLLLKDIRTPASTGSTQMMMAEVSHDSDEVMDEGEVVVSKPPPDNGNRYNLGHGANASALARDCMPPAPVTDTAPLSLDQRDETPEQRLEKLRAEGRMVELQLDSVSVMYQETRAEMVETELAISKLEAQ
jgi:hypothetical protein